MKKIALTARVDYLEKIGERRDAISQEWFDLFAACDFLPIILPNHKQLAQNLLETIPVDGILLTGGNDLDICGGTAPERDALERFLVTYALEHGLPLLGVCRGMQLILDYFGVPLKQVEGHVRTTHRLMNSGRIVNSYHNWAAVACVDALNVIDRCDDVIESIQHSDANIHGIMWHPERCHPFVAEDIHYLKGVFHR